MDFGLALRGSAKLCLGMPGYMDDFDEAIAMARSVQDPSTYVATVLLKYGYPVANSVLLPDVRSDQETTEALEGAERVGDDFARGAARLARGVVLQPARTATSSRPRTACWIPRRF